LHEGHPEGHSPWFRGHQPRPPKALLHAFGSAKGVGRASVVDLVKVDGINQPLAERIYGFFHPEGRG
jgi:excinuclease ABC subunit C